MTPSQEALTDADIKRIHDTQACLPDLVAMNDQWPEVLRFARAVIDADRKARQQEAPDARRLDWLEGELSREQAWLRGDQSVGKMPPSLFRSNMPITRAAIDAAIAKGERHE